MGLLTGLTQISSTVPVYESSRNYKAVGYGTGVLQKIILAVGYLFEGILALRVGAYIMYRIHKLWGKGMGGLRNSQELLGGVWGLRRKPYPQPGILSTA